MTVRLHKHLAVVMTSVEVYRELIFAGLVFWGGACIQGLRILGLTFIKLVLGKLVFMYTGACIRRSLYSQVQIWGLVTGEPEIWGDL